MIKTVVDLPNRPSTVPLSQAVVANGFVFASGQVGRDRQTRVAAAGIAAQTEQCLRNLEEVLRAANVGLGDVVKTTVFLKHSEDFEAMNSVYRRYFPVEPPARSTLQANMMADELLVEIEAIAAISNH
jgi:2-iminobutanoate/2-iminopropanoate deaminase